VPARVALEQRSPAGLTPEELAARVRLRRRYAVNAGELSDWLLRAELAVMADGRLVATPAGVEIGELLTGV
jgi:hypothetical protein